VKFSFETYFFHEPGISKFLISVGTSADIGRLMNVTPGMAGIFHYNTGTQHHS
jgi:hypothetical protein